MRSSMFSKPTDVTPYGSLVYLKHYVGDTGNGIFLVDIGLGEPIEHDSPKEPYFNRQSKNLQSKLRNLVDMRPSNLANQLVYSRDRIKERLSYRERHGGGLVVPNQKSSLGDFVYWILDSNGISSKNFDSPTSKTSRDLSFALCTKIGEMGLYLISVHRYRNPKNDRYQYDTLRFDLANYFKQD